MKNIVVKARDVKMADCATVINKSKNVTVSVKIHGPENAVHQLKNVMVSHLIDLTFAANTELATETTSAYAILDTGERCVVLRQRISHAVDGLLITQGHVEDTESALIRIIVIVTTDGTETIVETKLLQKPVGVFRGTTQWCVMVIVNVLAIIFVGVIQTGQVHDVV